MNNQMKFVILALLRIDGPTLKQLSYIDILIDINMPHLSIIIYFSSDTPDITILREQVH